MSITINSGATPWLLFVFTLPSGKASERVQVWRKLQKFGAIPFRNAGYLLPNSTENQERFEWAAKAVRSSSGEASLLEIAKVSDLSVAAVQDLFRDARTPDFEDLIKDMRASKAADESGSAQTIRFRKRLDEVTGIDFFKNPLRDKAEIMLANLERPQDVKTLSAKTKAAKKNYQNKTWITRFRPGIDRVASAWLISRFIDEHPKFIFGKDPSEYPKAIPFDMYSSNGFGHEGEDCTFETLVRAFGIADKSVLSIAQAIHDADLEDGKFGRVEGFTIHQILKGWAKQNVSDKDLLHKGMELMEGLYQSASEKVL